MTFKLLSEQAEGLRQLYACKNLVANFSTGFEKSLMMAGVPATCYDRCEFE